nr:ROK family protein [Thiothrix subterranea]
MHIGIDLGGTKTEVLLLNTHGQEIFRKRLPTPQGQYAAILQTIQQLVDEAEQHAGNHAAWVLAHPVQFPPLQV